MPRKSPAQLDREIAEALATTSGASLYDPKRLRAVSRVTQHNKRKDIEARFPIGSYAKGTRLAFAFEGTIGKVTGYDLGADEDAPRVKVRLLAPVEYMGKRVQAWTFDADAIIAVTQAQLAVDKLLQRMKALEAKHREASEDLRDAGRASDRITDAEERGTRDPARRKAAERGWAKAVRAEQALTNKMRDLVLQIRAIDPARVPWGWQNTR
jgi:hypothetical protein